MNYSILFFVCFLLILFQMLSDLEIIGLDSLSITYHFMCSIHTCTSETDHIMYVDLSDFLTLI